MLRVVYPILTEMSRKNYPTVTPLPRPVAFQLKVVVGYTTGGEMLLYDVVDFEPTSLTMKKDGASQNRPSVETGYDRGDAPSITSISDPVQTVKSMAKK